MISVDAPLPEAARIMRDNRIRHLPVVDEHQRLIGLVGRTDLLHASPAIAGNLSLFELNYVLANLHIRDVMSHPPITVREDAPLEEAARIMVENKIGSLPVMRDDALVGIITETDIFETFVECLGGGEPSLRVTLRVPDVRGELARLAGVIAGLGGDIFSVAVFRAESPEQAMITFRLEGVDEDTLVGALRDEVEEVVHVCCAS
jgi:acetoin utilization protein AcuB